MRPSQPPTSRPRRARRRFLALAAVAALAVTALPALAATDEDPDCAEPLATFSPDGTDGDVTAVAVTSQMLEQGREGWAEVGWETFGDLGPSSVTIVHTDGEVVHLDDPASGTASDVRELIFCGQTGGR